MRNREAPSQATIARRFRRYLLPWLALALLLAGCSEPAPPPERIVLGSPRSPLTSLLWLSDELGLFAKHGIAPELHDYPSGKRALGGLLNNEVDLAATAETPFVIAAFTHRDLRLYATMGQSDNEIRVLARRDHGIETASDLAGRTIATQRGSAVHFFLDSFLLYHGLNGRVQVRFLKAEALPGALVAGTVDAIAMRDPYLSEARESLAENQVIEFAEPGLYTKTYNLVGRADFLLRHPGAMEKLLRALAEGAGYARRDPEGAITIVARRLAVPRARIAALWPDIRLDITLNQGLLTTLQEEARWAIRQGLAEPPPPPLPERLDMAPLSRAVPHAVGLIGPQAR